MRRLHSVRDALCTEDVVDRSDELQVPVHVAAREASALRRQPTITSQKVVWQHELACTAASVRCQVSEGSATWFEIGNMIQPCY